MPAMDATAKAALEGDIAPAWFIYLDFLNDPIRVTTGPTVSFAGTGDPDLDGHTFSGIDPRVIDVGEVTHGDEGSDTVAVRLSALRTIDQSVLTAISTASNFRERFARLWFQIHDVDGATKGAIVPYYTGYMMVPEVLPSPETQAIEMRIENYRALLHRASGRTYLSQKDFDSNDTSAAATLAAANGGRGPAAATSTSLGSGGIGGYDQGDIIDRRNLL